MQENPRKEISQPERAQNVQVSYNFYYFSKKSFNRFVAVDRKKGHGTHLKVENLSAGRSRLKYG